MELEKSRPVPSPFMMNGSQAAGSEGFMVGGYSGTSPVQALPFHWMPGRLGSQGLPWRSAEARLYMTRRLSGQDHDQLGKNPMPVGSFLATSWTPSRRLERLASERPATVGADGSG